MKNIDVQKIMSAIKKEIEENNYENDVLSFNNVPMPVSNNEDNYKSVSNDFDECRLLESLGKVNNCREIKAYRQLTSHRKIIGKIIVFVKKIIRKIISFYIEPIVNDQNLFNLEVTKSLNEIEKYIANKDKDIQNLPLTFMIVLDKISEEDIKKMRFESFRPQYIRCVNINDQTIINFRMCEKLALDNDYVLFKNNGNEIIYKDNRM